MPPRNTYRSLIFAAMGTDPEWENLDLKFLEGQLNQGPAANIADCNAIALKDFGEQFKSYNIADNIPEDYVRKDPRSPKVMLIHFSDRPGLVDNAEIRRQLDRLQANLAVAVEPDAAGRWAARLVAPKAG